MAELNSSVEELITTQTIKKSKEGCQTLSLLLSSTKRRDKNGRFTKQTTVYGIYCSMHTHTHTQAYRCIHTCIYIYVF
jgi:hypothetical protein